MLGPKTLRSVALVLLGWAACKSDPPPATPQSACEAECNHSLDARCAADVKLTSDLGGCAKSCATGVSHLKSGCEAVYVAWQACEAAATITCDADNSVDTSLKAACTGAGGAVADCQKGVGSGGMDCSRAVD